MPMRIFDQGVTDEELQEPSLVRGNASRWFGLLFMETAEGIGIKVSESRVRVYASDLSDLQARDVIEAMRRARKEGSGFFPSIAEVRRGIVASPDDAALLAWNSLERSASDIGAWESVTFNDAATAEALEQTFGTWPEFCQMEIGPELALKRQQFLAAYRDARRRLPTTAPPRTMSGLLAGTGNYAGQPKQIGAPLSQLRLGDGNGD